MTTTSNLSQSSSQIANGSALEWPEAYLPEHADVFSHNELVIPAPAARIWQILLRAEEWPEWYANAAAIHFVSHTGPDLRDRSRFRWDKFGFRISSKVLEFVPERLLAWNAHGIGVEAYHIWQLTPLANGSTLVVTEETQKGWLPAVGKRLMPTHLQRRHQDWLEQLSRRAQAA
jgi:uncharacterized protein YndB with AHSA1/START domain